jgi:hypothetical protein
LASTPVLQHNDKENAEHIHIASSSRHRPTRILRLRHLSFLPGLTVCPCRKRRERASKSKQEQARASKSKQERGEKRGNFSPPFNRKGVVWRAWTYKDVQGRTRESKANRLPEIASGKSKNEQNKTTFATTQCGHATIIARHKNVNNINDKPCQTLRQSSRAIT